MLHFLLILSFASLGAAASPRQCPSPTNKGCGMPTWPNYWSMRNSIYTYCFEKCPLAFFANNTNLGVFGGVVRVSSRFCVSADAARVSLPPAPLTPQRRSVPELTGGRGPLLDEAGHALRERPPAGV